MKIICIGKNYVKHIQELNGSFDDNPTIFMKPDSSIKKSNSSKMIWKITELIHYASKYFTIKIGDIMFTGTPEGVGKVKIGDFLEGFIDKEKIFEIKIK